MTIFASDNVTSACPEVLEAVIAANAGDVASYGDDQWSVRLREKLSEIFETAIAVFPTVTGTASNALALSALTPSYGKVYCHELSHINTDECAAPEFFTGGAKLVAMPGDNGKFCANTLKSTIYGRGNVHHAQPSTISITQACETGAIYQIDEISELAEVAHGHGLSVHMDGARFANALASLDASPAEMTWKSGVDVLSFGGTKNGCLIAEAVIFFKPEMTEAIPFLHKRAGQLISKMRFVSAQLEAYISDGVWLRNARHANAMAARLSEGLAVLSEIELAYPTQSNEVFVRIPKLVAAAVRSDGFEVNENELDGSAARFITSWNTDPNDVARLLASFARHCSNITTRELIRD